MKYNNIKNFLRFSTQEYIIKEDSKLQRKNLNYSYNSKNVIYLVTVPEIVMPDYLKLNPLSTKLLELMRDSMIRLACKIFKVPFSDIWNPFNLVWSIIYKKDKFDEFHKKYPQ